MSSRLSRSEEIATDKRWGWIILQKHTHCSYSHGQIPTCCLPGREILKKDNLLLPNAEDEAIGPTKTLDQRLDYIGVVVGKLERDLDVMYRDFEQSTASMKQRMTEVERTFEANRTQIKRDCLLGLL